MYFNVLGHVLFSKCTRKPRNDKEFINELESKTSKIQTITCKFTQTQSLSVLSNKVSKKVSSIIKGQNRYYSCSMTETI